MNLENSVKTYRPSQAAIDVVREAKIALLVGISGAGKDSIKKQLITQDDFQDIVSHTTRPPRTNNGVGEIDGVDYHFIDESMALKMLDNQGFIEAKFVHGTVYGTSVAEVESASNQRKIAITDVDVQGVVEYKNLSTSVVALFILPPDYETWLSRLRVRYASEAEFQAEFAKRRASAIRELTHALETSYYHFIINDSLQRAVEVSSKIARSADTFHRKDDEARLLARDLLGAIEANQTI